MQEKEIKALLDNYKNGTASEAEKALLERWYLKYQEPEPYEFGLEERSKDLDLVLTRLKKGQQKPGKTYFWSRMAAAAILLFTLSAGLFFYVTKDNGLAPKLAKHDIAPGGNKATLTLANGEVINLTEAKTGDLGEQAGIQITKTADGQLIYTIEDSQNAAGSSLYNTIETPKGGQYQILLPDGSKVWLNAASSLRYPANLTAMNERRVELKGEAYFEVKKANRKPFIVATDKQEVEVLGTHFNVKSYPDDNSTKTTLLEGSVQVSPKSSSISGVILKPGLQAELKPSGLKVLTVEVEDEIDWKNGDFVFKEESLESIMRKIARWYDVDVVYRDDVPKNVALEGLVSRTKSISEVLSLIQSTGKVHFTIEGRRIVVTK
ncbi:FecR family protein [Pedobacter hiemivivus]|uniref:FecR family protein n=1 Tax=Pedobacter hiemivivus TaxID=2530454 RepID=A0A4U1G8R7_9SPHI|nr:FecR family protein [Pedobacter hiemivivus]TKC60221.1 FecR family protein [Pedobacter hiemivivus]